MGRVTSKGKLTAVRTALLAALIFGSIHVGTASAEEHGFNPTFPRLAAGQIGTRVLYDAERRAFIAKHQVAVINGWRHMTTPDGLNIATLPGAIKAINPDIKIFQYVNPVQAHHSVNVWEFVKNKVSSEKGPNGKPDWWLRDGSGNIMPAQWNPDTLWRINHTPSVTRDANGLIYPEWFARYVNAAPTDSGDWVSGSGRGQKEGDWDGIYVDDVYISHWYGVTADYNGDGVNDDRHSDFVRSLVMDGHIALVNEWRRLFANDNHRDRLVIANLSNQTDHVEQPLPNKMHGVYNGGWIEATTRSESWGGWDIMMTAYRLGMQYASEPKLVMFDHNIELTRRSYPNLPQSGWSDYRWNRYFLASALMDDGYYMITEDGYNYAAWFDEFDVVLGYPVDPPQYSAWSNGVYRREFQDGLVLVNPKGNGTRTVNVGAGWRRFQGTQDPGHNNGAISTEITLEAQDGIVLMRDGVNSRPKPPPAIGVD